MVYMNIYIPLGFDCNCSAKLRDNNLRKNAYPFDWNIVTYSSIYNIINNNFVDLFNKEYLIYSNKKIYHKYDNDIDNFKVLIPVFNIKYNILFIHDFVEMIDDSIIFDKYNKRITKFINTLSDINNNIILVYEDTSFEYINNIYTYWNDYFDDKDIFKNIYEDLNNNDYNIDIIKNLIKNKYSNNNVNICNINNI